MITSKWKIKALLVLLAGASTCVLVGLSLRIDRLPCISGDYITLLQVDECSRFSLFAIGKLHRMAHPKPTLVRLPVTLVDWHWTNVFVAEKQVVLKLPIFAHGRMKQVERYDSHVVMWARRDESSFGLQHKAIDFSLNPRFEQVGNSGLFNIYEQKPTKVSWRFFVPKSQPQHHFYLRCEVNCTLYGKYRFIQYELHIPFDWIDDVNEIQFLFHQLLDFIVI